MERFEALGIDSRIRKALEKLGFENPMPIQEKAIPALLEGNKDLIGLAQTGTGKTAAFGIPLLQLTDEKINKPQGLILCPTRELCIQITGDLTSFAEFLPGINIVAVYGGASIDNQLRALKRGVQVIVATPGRMIDIIERGKVDFSGIKYIVLDEADEMLNMGFREDIDLILSKTPDEKNVWLFSATMPKEVKNITKNYMSQPVEITAGIMGRTAENISHHYYVVQARDKYLALKRIADFYPDIFGIVFCRTKLETQDVAERLIKDGYNADSLHGDLSQAQRDKVMERYRNRSLQLLVATDVAARGIDVSNVTHVINYNLPDDDESYTHRSGRTARAGKSGMSISIVNLKEVYRIRELERRTGQKFHRERVPGGVEICEKQLYNLIDKVHDVAINEKEIAAYLPTIFQRLEDISREELVKRFVSIEFNRFLEYYKKAPDLNIEERDASTRIGVRKARIFISVGELDGMDLRGFLSYISKETGISKDNINRVDLKSSFSFFETNPENVPKILETFKDKKINDRPIRVEETSGERKDGRSRERNRYQGGGDRRTERGSERGAADRGGDRGDVRGGERRAPREGGFGRGRDAGFSKPRPSGFGGDRKAATGDKGKRPRVRRD